MLLSDQTYRKYQDIVPLTDIEILTDTGWEDVIQIMQTVPYENWEIELEDGKKTKCADTHIFFDENFNEIYAQDCLGQKIITKDGASTVVKAQPTGIVEPMYDVTVNSDNQRYYGDYILSHNSVTSVAWLLHYMVFNADKKVALLANKGAIAREMLSRFTLMLENLPFFLQPGVRVLNKGNIVFAHNSEIIAASTSSSSIRGISANIIFLDEFAFVHKAEQFYTSTYPVITSGKDTKVIITSTPNGVGNMFYKLWQGAISNSNEFKAFSIHWRDVPGRDEAWRAKTIANTSEAQFDQEFGCQFVGSADTLISSSCLLGLQAMNPVKTQHDIVYYDEPDPDHSYILVADVAKGRGQDYSTFSVIDITSKQFKQVCTYRNNTISPLLFPGIIVRAAIQYNQALIIVENNDAGQVVCNAIYYDYEYENMFTTSAVKSNGIGVVMTKKVKRIGCSNLKDLMEANKIHIVDPHTISELANFVPKGDSFAAADSTHDDSVMNLVLFAWFVSTDIFNSMSDVDLRELLYAEKILEMEEDLPPFGFVGENTSTISAYDELINNAREWHGL